MLDEHRKPRSSERGFFICMCNSIVRSPQSVRRGTRGGIPAFFVGSLDSLPGVWYNGSTESCHQTTESRGFHMIQGNNYLNPVLDELAKQWPANRLVNVVCHGHSVPAGFFATPYVNTFGAYPICYTSGSRSAFPLRLPTSSSPRSAGRRLCRARSASSGT